MLALLLAAGGTGLHLPTVPQFSAARRAQSPVAQATADAEEAAKAAWLAKVEQAWDMGRVVGTTAAAPDAAPDASDSTSTWITPGKPVLTLEAADEMATVALREAQSRSFNPVSVCVMDAGGRTIVTKTMIESSGLAPAFAACKASTCIAMHCSSRELRDMYISSEGAGPKMPQVLAMGTAGAAASLPLAPFPGGVLCRDAAQNLLGAIGVSGARSDEDEHCAITAAQSVGLVTEPASSQLG